MKENQEKELEDLLSDPQFAKWVKDPDPDLELFWQKWIENHPHKKKIFQEAIFLIRHINFKQQDLNIIQFDRVLKQVLNQNYSSKHSSENFFHWHRLSNIAAVIILIVTAYYSFQSRLPHDLAVESKQKIVQVLHKSNPNGQKSKFNLPDGTIVHLNASSSISYPQQFSDEIREVKLSGEAFFEVAPDAARPMIVKTDALTITALGTAFNVKAFPSDLQIDVALTHGKVRVDNLIGDPSELSPGDLAIFNRKTKKVMIDEFDPEQAIGWIDNKIVFASDDFDAFIIKLTRWYGIEITVTGKPDNRWRIKGVFENTSLELLMESVKFSKDIDYKLSGNQLEIILND